MKSENQLKTFHFSLLVFNFLLISFLLLGFVGFSQTTAIPDPNFEQALIDLEIDTNVKNNNILNFDAVAVISFKSSI